jgi:molybdopterin/thiamine biosynthesis adenylyltransferase
VLSLYVSTIFIFCILLLQGGPCYRCMFPTPPPLETVTGMYPPPHMTCMYPPPHMTCMYPPLETVTGTLLALVNATQLNTLNATPHNTNTCMYVCMYVGFIYTHTHTLLSRVQYRVTTRSTTVLLCTVDPVVIKNKK